MRLCPGLFRALLPAADMCSGENVYQNATRKGPQSLAAQGAQNSFPVDGYQRGYQ